MSKELSPLEHLEFIRNYEIDEDHRTLTMNYACKQSLDIIETALNDYEELQKDYCEVVEKNGEWQEKNRKKLKALKVIKEKDFIDINLLRKSKNMYEYNRNLAYRYGNTKRKNDICLIQNEEEYDLLREVLL